MIGRLTIVQNRPTQFDMPLYARMHANGDWDLQVIYTGDSNVETVDRELGHPPCWDHVTDADDRGIYLDAETRRKVDTIADRIVAHRPDLVVLCGYRPILHARLVGALKRGGIKIGLRSDNTLQHSDLSGLKGVAKRVVLPWWLARYDCWFPVGSQAGAYLCALSAVKRPVFCFPYAVDVEWFERESARARERRAEHRARLGLSSEDFVVLGILKWHPREDPMTLLNAFAGLRSRHRRARLVLLGDGPLADEVERAVGRMDADVALPGYRPYSELPRWYAISDVFVHPAPSEPWGVSVQEALACSLPVLAADGVGSRFDLLEDGCTGWTFPNGDDEALCSLLDALIRDPALRTRMAAAAPGYAQRMDYAHSESCFRVALEQIAHAR